MTNGFNATVRCIEGSPYFHQGEIYNIINGVIRGSNRVYGEYKSIEEINTYIFAKFELIKEDKKSIKHNFLPSDVQDVIINNNTVIVNLKDGRKGISKCSKEDIFDTYSGFVNAYYRAKNDHIFDLKNVLNNCVKSANKKGYKQAILKNYK